MDLVVVNGDLSVLDDLTPVSFIPRYRILWYLPGTNGTRLTIIMISKTTMPFLTHQRH